MTTRDKAYRDLIGAVLIGVLGIAVAVAGSGYGIGSLVRMGPGYLPMVIGVLMTAVALLIGLTAFISSRKAPLEKIVANLSPVPKHGEWSGFQWRGWFCILGGVAAFVLLGAHGGLVPATFAAVFVSAMGDLDNSPRDAALLAAGITVAGAAIFNGALHMPFDLFSWG